jgi:hypothetical protein
MWGAVSGGRFFSTSHISLPFIISTTLFGNSLSEGNSTLAFPSLWEIPRRINCFRLALSRNSKIVFSTRSVGHTNTLPNRKADPWFVWTVPNVQYFTSFLSNPSIAHNSFYSLNPLSYTASESNKSNFISAVLEADVYSQAFWYSRGKVWTIKAGGPDGGLHT